MRIDKALLDALTEQAKVSPRRRQSYDLRTSPADQSQRMLNAIEPGTHIPIHRHTETTETVVVLRGRCVQYLYDGEGYATGAILMEANAGATGGAKAGDANRTKVGGFGGAKSAEETDCVEAKKAGGAQTEEMSGAEAKKEGGAQATEMSNAAGDSIACPAMTVEVGQWHRLESLEPGTVIFEAKDGVYAPMKPEDTLPESQDIVSRLIAFIEAEHRSQSMEVITSLYVYRMWGGQVPQEKIALALKLIQAYRK